MKMKLCRTIFLAMLSLWSGHACAGVEAPVRRTVALDDSAEVTATSDDSAGHLWIATSNFSLGRPPRFLLPHVLELTSGGDIAEDYEMKLPQQEAERQGGYTVLGFSVAPATIVAVLGYSDHDLWWTETDRRSRQIQSRKLMELPRGFASSQALLSPSLQSVLIYGSRLNAPAAVHLTKTGQILWSTTWEKESGRFADAVSCSTTSFTLLEQDIDVVKRSVTSKLLLIDPQGNMIAEKGLDGNASVLTCSTSNTTGFVLQRKTGSEFVQVRLPGPLQEQTLPESITGAQLVKSQPQSGLQGVVGYERGQAVYLELNARGETARKVLLQDKPEEAILNLRARQVAGTIYVLGNVYLNSGRGFIEKLAFVALEGITHR